MIYHVPAEPIAVLHSCYHHAIKKGRRPRTLGTIPAMVVPSVQSKALLVHTFTASDRFSDDSYTSSSRRYFNAFLTSIDVCRCTISCCFRTGHRLTKRSCLFNSSTHWNCAQRNTNPPVLLWLDSGLFVSERLLSERIGIDPRPPLPTTQQT